MITERVGTKMDDRRETMVVPFVRWHVDQERLIRIHTHFDGLLPSPGLLTNRDDFASSGTPFRRTMTVRFLHQMA
jgi:hypothetical protein